jgi:hypothetical protein
MGQEGERREISVSPFIADVVSTAAIGRAHDHRQLPCRYCTIGNRTEDDRIIREGRHWSIYERQRCPEYLASRDGLRKDTTLSPPIFSNRPEAVQHHL